MDEGLDTGDEMLQTRIEIAPDETGGSLHDRLAEIGPGALEAALGQLQAGTAPRIPQDSSAATYAPKLEREHGRIDWTEPAALIERKIRAFTPWPGAFAILRDEAGTERKLKIFRARIVSESSDPEKLVIAATDGALRLEEVQLEEKADERRNLRGCAAAVRLAYLRSRPAQARGMTRRLTHRPGAAGSDSRFAPTLSHSVDHCQPCQRSSSAQPQTHRTQVER
jgi:methionyl-tRNA formyltransferase